jgi:GNAT superfamily N-acetyltransferase
MPITLAELELVDADPKAFNLSTFDCEDSDLNEFVKVDCPRYKEQGLSHTKLALYSGNVVGYVALLADSISLETSERQWLIQKNVHVQHIPALKIGRLAIDKRYKGQRVGSALVKYSVGVAFRLNSDLSVGCRFLTVDAYQQSIGFYERLGFVKSLHKQYKKREHPSMHYDIITGPIID